MMSGRTTAAINPVVDLNPTKEMSSRHYWIQLLSESADHPEAAAENDPMGKIVRIEKA